LTLRDSSDYIARKKAVLIKTEKDSGKSTNPVWTSSTIEYYNSNLEGIEACCDIIPQLPELNYERSTQTFGSYANNTYLTNITVNWKRTDRAYKYRVFLIELKSDNTSVESDELKSAPSSFMKQTGSFPDFSYELQYSYQSELLGVNTLSWVKTYLPSERIAKVYAFVFAYSKFGTANLPINSQPSLRYSVFDVKPLIPLNTSPLLDFPKINATRSGSNITWISINWTPLNNAFYYRIFLIEGDFTPYVQTQSRFLVNPQRYDNTGDLFTSNSGNLNINIIEFEKRYTDPVTTITAFVYAFDVTNVPCPFPGRCITFNGTTGIITIDYTLNSPNNGINYFLNEDGSSYLDRSPTLPLPSLDSKPFL